MSILNEPDDAGKPANGFALSLRAGETRVLLDWSLLAWLIAVAFVLANNSGVILYMLVALPPLILIHELGHLIAAKSLGYRVSAFHIAVLGGHVVVDFPKTLRHGFLIYGSGVAAQLLVLAVTILATVTLGFPKTPFWLFSFYALTFANLILVVTSLIPRTVNGMPSDGLVLWRLTLLALGKETPFGQLLAADTNLLDMNKMVPAGFTCGLQALNDKTTPMEFVVSVFGKYLQMPREEAISIMMQVHREGGALIPTATMALAMEIASGISADAQAAGHVLACEAVQR